MKEAIGGVSLFQIVILFLLLFTGVMCLTINHSKAFGVKDEIINILETDILASYGTVSSYEVSTDTMTKIINHLNEVGYRITGDCPSGYVGYDRNYPNDKKTVSTNASFCVRSVNVSNAYRNDLLDKCKNNKCDITYDDFPSMIYYDVILFYQLDIPIISKVFNLKLYGSTKTLLG